jgi:5-methylcytosine-specific restriction protein B
MNRIWIYSPGRQASYWEEFYVNGIMAIGTGELGDLLNYKNKDEIGKQLQIFENITSSLKNDANAFWDITPACRNIPSRLH